MQFKPRKVKSNYNLVRKNIEIQGNHQQKNHTQELENLQFQEVYDIMLTNKKRNVTIFLHSYEYFVIFID